MGLFVVFNGSINCCKSRDSPILNEGIFVVVNSVRWLLLDVVVLSLIL